MHGMCDTFHAVDLGEFTKRDDQLIAGVPTFWQTTRNGQAPHVIFWDPDASRASPFGGSWKVALSMDSARLRISAFPNFRVSSHVSCNGSEATLAQTMSGRVKPGGVGVTAS